MKCSFIEVKNQMRADDDERKSNFEWPFYLTLADGSTDM